MSGGTHVVHAHREDVAHGAGDHSEEGAPHGTLKEYVIGFVLSVILTAIPFALVMTHALPKTATALLIVGFAVIQILVHMIFFLHMNTRSEGGWIMLSLIFTLVLVVIALSGSLWVMYHMNANMMPMASQHEGMQPMPGMKMP